MKIAPQVSPLRWMVLGLILVLASCGGSSNAPPVAKAVVASMDEDTVYQGIIEASDSDGDPLTFSVSAPPSHGTATIDARTGSFTYTPNPDYFGSDSFSVSVRAKGGMASANVTLAIRNVYDPPRLQAIPDQKNSAYTLDSDIPLDLVDVDGNPLTVTTQVDDPSIATAQVESSTQTLRVTPLARGKTNITVTASDGQSTVSTTFAFNVGDVTKTATVQPNTLAANQVSGSGSNTAPGQVVSLTNNSVRDVTFTLTYNHHKAFTSLSEIADYVRGMPEGYLGEPFQRKLWRFVNENTYHDVPINAQQWWYDYWPTLNSLGFGFCGHRAAVYVEVARAAGYDARVWGLTGHVVPEIFADGRWQMFDPDLDVYYFTRDGAVAGVEDLAADPSLITSPTTPIYVSADNFVYSATIADIYDDIAGNNYVADSVFLASAPAGRSQITLPAGSRLLLPGHWTAAPTGYDGDTPYQVRTFRQAAIELPPGWTGSINLPWVLWDVQGVGSISVGGTNFAAGSYDLRNFLAAPGAALTSGTVLDNPSGLRLVFMINATWYDFLNSNDVQITGQDVWAVNIGTTTVGADVQVGPLPN